MATSNVQKNTSGSFLDRLFSSPLVRGFYNNEKPEIEFDLAGSNSERKRLTHLINSIAKNSPTGRKILETASKEGYTLCFENLGLTHGICNSHKKCITLNPRINDAKLMATLTHESRHAGQAVRLPQEFLKYDVATELRLHRAEEADAQAAAMQTVLEIRAATGNEKPVEELRKTDPKLFTGLSHSDDRKASLETVMADRDKNMTAAFCGWFESDVTIRLYEHSYLGQHLNFVNENSDRYKNGFFEKWTMDRHLTSAEIVKNICTGEKDAPYITDLNIMNRPKMSRISDATKQAADKFFSDRERLTGKAADKSYVGTGKTSLQQTLTHMNKPSLQQALLNMNSADNTAARTADDRMLAQRLGDNRSR